MISAIRQATWFVHDKPRAGVLRFGSVDAKKVEVGDTGTSPQPVKKRCWWSSVRRFGFTFRFPDDDFEIDVRLCWSDAGSVGVDDGGAFKELDGGGGGEDSMW